jgi:DNA-binding response OmpR family regulator
MILASQGYRVVLASDGEEGIARAKAERPALILVDFVMPKMNGFQVCKALKEDPDFKDTPIILVTSKGDKVGSKFVDVLGISEYFTKPFQPEELLAKIREVLDKGKKKQVPTAAAAITSVGAAPTPPRGVPRTPPAAAPEQPAAPSFEAMVRDVVERIVDELRRTVLPDLIRRELVKARSAAAAGAGGRSEPGIRGDLSSFRLVEVMQMLGLQRQTGRLAVTGVSGDLAIYFKDGSITFATTRCNGTPADMLDGVLRKTCRIEDGSLQHALRIADMTGDPIDKVLVKERLLDARSFANCLRRHTESVVYRAMALEEGEFVFEKAPPPAFANAVQLKVDDLLLEGARRSDEWVLIQQKIPSFDLVFESMIGNSEELATRGLGDLDASVFSLVDGRRTVQDIIDELCLGEFEVAKSLFILLSVNLIRQKN